MSNLRLDGTSSQTRMPTGAGSCPGWAGLANRTLTRPSCNCGPLMAFYLGIAFDYDRPSRNGACVCVDVRFLFVGAILHRRRFKSLAFAGQMQAQPGLICGSRDGYGDIVITLRSLRKNEIQKLAGIGRVSG